MEQLMKALKGKKTNLIAAWAFCGALFMWMNGFGEAEVSATLATVAALAASLRAGIAKNGTAMVIICGCASLFLLGGCAALGLIDPATGTSPAQDIVVAAGETAALFGPAIGIAVPIGLASLLTVLIALGKVKPPTEPVAS